MKTSHTCTEIVRVGKHSEYHSRPRADSKIVQTPVEVQVRDSWAGIQGMAAVWLKESSGSAKRHAFSIPAWHQWTRWQCGWRGRLMKEGVAKWAPRPNWTYCDRCARMRWIVRCSPHWPIAISRRCSAWRCSAKGFFVIGVPSKVCRVVLFLGSSFLTPAHPSVLTQVWVDVCVRVVDFACVCVCICVVSAGARCCSESRNCWD